MDVIADPKAQRTCFYGNVYYRFSGLTIDYIPLTLPNKIRTYTNLL